MSPENPFKKLEENLREVPDDLKKKVLNDALRAKLLLEVSSHFLNDIPKVLLKMFEVDSKNKK